MGVVFYVSGRGASVAAFPRRAWKRLEMCIVPCSEHSPSAIVPTLCVVTHPVTLRVTNHYNVFFLRLVLVASFGNRLVSCWLVRGRRASPAALPRRAWERLVGSHRTMLRRALSAIVPTLRVVTHPVTLRVTNLFSSCAWSWSLPSAKDW